MNKLNTEQLNSATKGSANIINHGRRKVLSALGAGVAIALPGCCCRPFPRPLIDGNELKSANVGTTFLAPTSVNKVLTQNIFCVDVHTHFFNASDVTVKGYLAGPVAHSVGGIQGRLLKLLAPLADELAALAPRAKEEYDYLAEFSSSMQFKSAAQVAQALDTQIERHRQEQSSRFYELLMTSRGRPFVEEYKRIQLETLTKRLRAGTPPMVPLDEQSLARAMDLGEVPRTALNTKQLLPAEDGAYAESSLAFVGYMLSYRWANLRTYQKAFSTHEESVGVDRVLGSLVDFDRWLECPPRSAHEDQMKLHARISNLSGGYMLPLISYNPWTDIADKGRSLALVEEAVTKYGFVGAKIYPANGFRPWGNAKDQSGIGIPSPDKINRALEAFWDKCIELNIPVMAHTGQSMGRDDAHDMLGGPEGWEALIAAYASKGKSPLVNLGHFGGDTDGAENDWTKQMAKVMTRPYADKIFGDLGYWSELQCNVVGPDPCQKAAERLGNVLNGKLNDHERIADRVMFGSDWLMLSRQPNWSEYVSELFSTIESIAPDDVVKIFGKNAVRCFGSRIERA